METKNNTAIILLGLFSSKAGSPVAGAKVWLESEPSKNLVAFQQTGATGCLTFAYLDKGVYKIFLEIPRQKGSLDETQESAAANFQIGYHGKKMILLFQNPMGNFRLKYTDAEKLTDSKITPMHESETGVNSARIAICKFEVAGKSGKISLRLSSLSAGKFQKLLKRYENDAEMGIITR